MVVSLSLLLTLGAWQFSKTQVEFRIGLRFEAARDQTLGLIAERMRKYEDALWAGVAAVESHGGEISYENWHSFARTLRIEEKYPGINGIGMVHFHTAQTLAPYVNEQQRVRPDFRVYPDHDKPEKMPITFIEPVEMNAAAVGLDVAHETNRRRAAMASRDTGTAQITGPIVLVQDANHTAGFLFYAPIYQGEVPADLATRKVRSIGAIYAPFVVHKLMEGLLAKELRHVRFSITDNSRLIYDEHTADDPMVDPNPMFSEMVSLNMYGRTWIMDIRSDRAFRQQNVYAQPTFLLIAGLVIEALIISLMVFMARANKRAIAYADKVSLSLKEKSSRLAAANDGLANKNEELEQFAYVASHDLKTPLRGISGLTEMIEEDLEDYFASPSANPDVGANLEKIHERIRRMNELTHSILGFSQITANTIDNGPLVLQEVVATLALDFGLGDEQLLLLDEVGPIVADSINLRRVLENLVGNAIKYHHGENTLHITISAQNAGDRCRLSVTDNGPGIDPKFHNRIFDVFQTLRTGSAPESSGIGLSIAKKAVELHGGKIDLVSSPGAGASFSFDWPINTTPSGLNTDEAA